ncbi:MAG: DUF2779 domain-containing protein, partial [Dokdonella sp.]
MKTPARLSKSRILSGLQCERRLWLETYRRELREVTAGQQIVFDNGNALGELARELYGPGVLIEHVMEPSLALAETQALRNSDAALGPMFEPAFAHDGVVIRADVLLPVGDGHELIEVKGSTSVKDYYISDCAVQTWVVEGAGVPLSYVRLAHLDRSFVYAGGGDYNGLLHAEDVTDDVRERMAEVPGWVERFRTMLAGPEPAIKTGDHCSTPYGCPFWEHCRGQEPADSEYPVDLLPYGGNVVRELLAEGFTDLRDVPADRLYSERHQRVHAATLANTVFNDPAAAQELAALPWPRHYLDFETIGFAIPRWIGTRPYQQVGFQWSCQTQQRDGSLVEQWFLDLSGNAPMRGFAESMLATLENDDGCIVVYNSGFESARIKELATMLPDLADRLHALLPRLFDLLPLTRDNYYHPAMKGSWSIKAVLPTIAPELAYENLQDVADGSEAQVAWHEATAMETSRERRAELDMALRRY